MRAALTVSALWAAASVAVLQTAPGPLVLTVVLFYILIGSGLPAAAAVARWGALDETAAPNWMVVLLLAIATSFAATALGGQPLVWTSRWTASRHIVATMVVGMILAFVAERVSRPKVAP
ncbi:MAG: hypothetical protein AAFN30_11265 [Actinomycetota bacterium]